MCDKTSYPGVVADLVDGTRAISKHTALALSAQDHLGLCHKQFAYDCTKCQAKGAKSCCCSKPSRSFNWFSKDPGCNTGCATQQARKFEFKNPCAKPCPQPPKVHIAKETQVCGPVKLLHYPKTNVIKPGKFVCTCNRCPRYDHPSVGFDLGEDCAPKCPRCETYDHPSENFLNNLSCDQPQKKAAYDHPSDNMLANMMVYPECGPEADVIKSTKYDKPQMSHMLIPHPKELNASLQQHPIHANMIAEQQHELYEKQIAAMKSKSKPPPVGIPNKSGNLLHSIDNGKPSKNGKMKQVGGRLRW